MLSRAEAAAASVAATPAIAILAAYLPLRAGRHVSPAAVLIVTIAAAAVLAWRLARHATADRWDLALVSGVAGAVFITTLGLAWPALLPIGGGPDLTHHLVLINHLERAWRLVDDPALYSYLGDMMDYTPGSHLLIALAAAWTRTDGLHAAHGVLAASVAIKAGLVFCVARRAALSTPFAVAAAALLLLPTTYVTGSFTVQSYWAQVVAELFAVAAWWALTAWDGRASTTSMALFALFGAAAFLSWPIWTGPIVLAAAAVVWLREGLSRRTKLGHFSVGCGPIVAVAAIHSIGRFGRLGMAGTSGYAIRPSAAAFGWIFIVLATAGVASIARSRRGRTTIVLILAILAQSLALFVVARASAADTPYMALKMFYLLPYPLAVAGAWAIAAATRHRFGWIVAGALTIAAGHAVATSVRPRPIVTQSTLDAGQWARDHVDRACVDYLVADGYTGYWLHLAVLDNPRGTPRFDDVRTFDPQKAIERWVDSDGLPYAIVDDVSGFSKALFSGTDDLAAFGPSRVIKRRGRAVCR